MAVQKMQPAGESMYGQENSEQYIGREKLDEGYDMPLPGRKGDGRETRRREEDCDRNCGIPADWTEDHSHVPGGKWRKLKEIRVNTLLEQVGWLYLVSLAWEDDEKQEMQERNVSGKKKCRRNARPDMQN